MTLRWGRLYETLGRVELSHITLYIWLFLGKVWVVYAGDIPLPHSLPWGVHAGWLTVGFAAPVMVWTGYWLIYKVPGYGRYIGYWLRLGGDISQTCIMTIFLYGMLSMVYGGSRGHVFGSFFILALLSYLVSMIVRDVLAVAGTECLASRMRRDE